MKPAKKDEFFFNFSHQIYIFRLKNHKFALTNLNRHEKIDINIYISHFSIAVMGRRRRAPKIGSWCTNYIIIMTSTVKAASSAF